MSLLQASGFFSQGIRYAIQSNESLTKPLLLSQVVKAGSHMAVDWAYKNGGLQSSTGLPDVTVHWDGWRRLLVAGETLTVDS